MYVDVLVIKDFILFTEVVSVSCQSVSHITACLAHVLLVTVYAMEAVDHTGGQTVEGGVDGVDGVVRV